MFIEYFFGIFNILSGSIENATTTKISAFKVVNLSYKSFELTLSVSMIGTPSSCAFFFYKCRVNIKAPT